MALDDDIRILSAVGLFEGFTPEQLRLLAFGAEQVRLSADQLLYREEDDADCAYVVQSGRIALFRDEGEGRRLVGVAETGSMLGELALIAETQRLTSAAAAIDSQLLRLTRSVFRRILEEYPDLAVTLHQRVLEEFETLVRSIEELEARFAG